MTTEKRWFERIGGHQCAALMLLLTCLHAKAEPLTNVTFVAFDLETTGFSPASCRVVEIGAVKLKNGQIVERQAWLVNPGIPIPRPVQRVHGITDQMVKDALSFKQAFREFMTFAGDAVLLAHNARFDVGFVRAEIQRNDLPTPRNQVFDTLAFARAVYPDAPGYSLRSLMQHLESSKSEFHRALADSRHVASLFLAGTRTPSPANTLKEFAALCGGALTFAQSK